MNEASADNTSPEPAPPSGFSQSPIASRLVGYGLFLVIVVVLILLFIPGTRRSRESARRLQCLNNMRNVGIAVLNYQTEWGVFPPAYTVDATGQPLHSWRTLILPYLDEKDLYEKIDLTKPWDDPVNAEARQTPVQVYRCAESKAPETHTHYLAFVGDDYAFAPTKPRQPSEITDGITQTLMLMEAPANFSVEWMAPQNGAVEQFLAINKETPLLHAKFFNAIFCDGHATSLPPDLAPETRTALMTISAGDEAGEY